MTLQEESLTRRCCPRKKSLQKTKQQEDKCTSSQLDRKMKTISEKDNYDGEGRQ